jgi:hypothetical protein
MARKTIRAAQFMYYVPTGRIVFNSKTKQEQEQMGIRHAFRGDTVDIPRPEDVERGEAGGAFMEDEAAAAPPEPKERELDFSSHESLVWWIKEEKPTISEVVDAADNDPEKAEALLAAENEATGGQSRKGVISGLRSITQADEE